MLLLITDRSHLANYLLEVLSEEGIFLFRATLENGAFLCRQKDIGGVVIDAVGNLVRASEVCRTLRSEYPDIPIACLVLPRDIPDMPADRILREHSPLLLVSEILEFCHACGWITNAFGVYHLTVGKTPSETIYMGYPLPLSPSEHRILRCLFYRSPRLTSKEDLLELCYPSRHVGVSNVEVMIRRINSHASKIDPRPLVVNVYGKGYRLREGIL